MTEEIRETEEFPQLFAFAELRAFVNAIRYIDSMQLNQLRLICLTDLSRTSNAIDEQNANSQLSELTMWLDSRYDIIEHLLTRAESENSSSELVAKMRKLVPNKINLDWYLELLRTNENLEITVNELKLVKTQGKHYKLNRKGEWIWIS